MRPNRTGTFDPVGRHLANEPVIRRHGELGRRKRERERSASHPEEEEEEEERGEAESAKRRVGGRTCYSRLLSHTHTHTVS